MICIVDPYSTGASVSLELLARGQVLAGLALAPQGSQRRGSSSARERVRRARRHLAAQRDGRGVPQGGRGDAVVVSFSGVLSAVY